MSASDATEGKDRFGYAWIQDLRYDDFYYLKDFEHLVIMKVTDWCDDQPKTYWEAIVFEDESCQKIVGRQACATLQDAKYVLEHILEISLKNRKVG
jgi:hypothetical protein